MTIRDVASQTELIAINSAIESARAGKSGQGFVIIAEEVRKLAENSAKAASMIEKMVGSSQEETKNVMGLIERGVSKIEEGRDRSVLARRSLKKITEGFLQMDKQVHTIGEASQRQTQSSISVKGAIEEVSRQVKHMSDSVLEVKEALSDLNDLAEILYNTSAHSAELI